MWGDVVLIRKSAAVVLSTAFLCLLNNGVICLTCLVSVLLDSQLGTFSPGRRGRCVYVLLGTNLSGPTWLPSSVHLLTLAFPLVNSHSLQ